MILSNFLLILKDFLYQLRRHKENNRIINIMTMLQKKIAANEEFCGKEITFVEIGVLNSVYRFMIERIAILGKKS